MPAGNPAGYAPNTSLPSVANQAHAAGASDALTTLGLGSGKSPAAPLPSPKVVQPPTPKGVSSAVSANMVPKHAAFSMSPNPDKRALEAQRDNVRQPDTNEDQRVAPGIDPAFNYLRTPSESDPYTIPRLF